MSILFFNVYPLFSMPTCQSKDLHPNLLISQTFYLNYYWHIVLDTLLSIQHILEDKK